MNDFFPPWWQEHFARTRELAEHFENPTSDSGVELTYGSTGLSLRGVPTTGCYAEITEAEPGTGTGTADPPYYSWIQVRRNTESKAWEPVESGLFGDYLGGGAGAATERMGFYDVPPGTVVWLELERSVWLFDYTTGWRPGGSVEYNYVTHTYNYSTINLNNSTLHLGAGTVLQFDTLVLESGSTTTYQSGSILIFAGPTVNLTDTQTWTLSAGETWFLTSIDATAIVALDWVTVNVGNNAIWTYDGTTQLVIQNYLELCCWWAWCYDDSSLSTITTTQNPLDISSIKKPTVAVPIDANITLRSIRFPGNSAVALLRNTGSGTATITHLDGSATVSGERVATPTGLPLKWPPGATLLLKNYPSLGYAEIIGGTALAGQFPPGSIAYLPEVAEPSSPGSGYAAFYIDTADGKPKVKISGGTVYDLSGGGGFPPATPPTSVTPTAVPTWFLVATLTHADLTDADTSQDVTAYTLPAKAAVGGGVIRTKTAGSGGGVSALSVQLAIGGTMSGLIGDGLAANNIGGQYAPSSGGIGATPHVQSWTATTAVAARFISSGANLADLTAGEWEVFLLLSTLG